MVDEITKNEENDKLSPYNRKNAQDPIIMNNFYEETFNAKYTVSTSKIFCNK